MYIQAASGQQNVDPISGSVFSGSGYNTGHRVLANIGLARIKAYNAQIYIQLSV